MADVTPVAELEDGAPARVSGVVRAGPQTLRSDLLGHECVFWEVRSALGADGDRRGVAPFWIEDPSGRVLVTGKELEVEVRARRARDVLEVVGSDTKAVSEELRALKQKLKRATGPEVAEIRSRRERLAKVATFLFTVRAHTKGRIHLSGKTLKQQQRWIEDNAPDGDEAAATVEIAVTRYEVVLSDGDTVLAEGVARDVPIPPGMGNSGGYRDRPTCLALRAGADGVVRVTGVGASQPRSKAERRALEEGTQSPAPAPRWRPPPRDDAFERNVVRVVGAGGVLAVLAWLIERLL